MTDLAPAAPPLRSEREAALRALLAEAGLPPSRMATAASPTSDFVVTTLAYPIAIATRAASYLQDHLPWSDTTLRVHGGAVTVSTHVPRG